jgi:hypothetical protein
MKTKLFAAALAALTLATAGVASAQDFDRGRDGRDGRYERDRGDWRHRAEITVRKDGRVFSFDRHDRMFHRLLDRPFNFRPGLTYAYTDRCNRNGCVAFVFDGRHRRPIDRVFAPHLREARGYAFREARDFDRGYNRYGRYDRDDRGWSNDDDRSFREGRDRGDWDGDGRRDRDGDRRRNESLYGGPDR